MVPMGMYTAAWNVSTTAPAGRREFTQPYNPLSRSLLGKSTNEQGSERLHLMSKSTPHHTKNTKGWFSPQEDCPLNRTDKQINRINRTTLSIGLKNRSFLNDPKQHGFHARDEVLGTNIQH